VTVLDQTIAQYIEKRSARHFQEQLGRGTIPAVMRYASLGLLLFCILVIGCASAEQKRKQHMEAKQRFTTVMNQMIGKTTYEKIIGDWGPPSDRRETGSEISGLWEDQLVGGPVVISQTTNYQGWRVRMVFDRKSMLLKSWEEIGSDR
jgi:hypothetical protein